ncbi:MAG: UDP-N-acetylmuramoyl-L-alanine--D-glutamate ligase [Rudaea sp.]|uniref:UDP-N-acetylmuramoyl-L-alanine--D-glutamate ligase n=1 Tax=unclassified Rudaea TaxID=2627037 RepID=UPI0010F9E539|nr:MULTISPECIES: UDP-N-acetylmuramoyl-L-alanine--D-glutamate ligase [unclassified Rudaea]MBN8884277.1 UDP-N-acetylmuramoyl-L-alanine--D-glutamate ligase [Rudaea sp.]MBR0345310.1 UDP-N-acetylmuramoyl-L-alanine--D-glutamate ligase [Rudaea sp.]
MRIADDAATGPRLSALAGKRVAIWGYGREGRAALSVLRRRFPDQPITLFCSEAEAGNLAAHGLGAGFDGHGSLSELEKNERHAHKLSSSQDAQASHPADSGIKVITSSPDAAALSHFDVVIKSPGISPYREPYLSAQQAGVRFTSASAIWFAERPDAKTICVTGTKGKSTLASLVAHLLRKSGRLTALAGNIGLPLLELLDVESEPDWWVIELSSFQTRDFAGASTIAVVNNLYEEHLDWHLTRENYAADKLSIAQAAQRIVVNAAQPELVQLAARDFRYAFNRPEGWHLREAAIWRGDERVLAIDEIPLPGEHNALNVCAALAAVEAASEFEADEGRRPPLDLRDARRLREHLAEFKALPHRLQHLGARGGIDYVNDSISTTPYAAIEALRSLHGHATTILVGGFDRGVDWRPFVDFVAERPPRAIVTMGANGEAIAEALGRIAHPGFQLESTRMLADAFVRAQTLTEAGGTILLSPGAPSFDQFTDYAERGREFARLAGFDPAAIVQIEGLGIA